jgi:hypothetical protein
MQESILLHCMTVCHELQDNQEVSGDYRRYAPGRDGEGVERIGLILNFSNDKSAQCKRGRESDNHCRTAIKSN